MPGSFVKKLKIKSSDSLLVFHAPENHLQKIREEPGIPQPDISIGSRDYNFMLLFVVNQEELESLFPELLKHYLGEGNFWVAYPKKSAEINSDLDRKESWRILGKYNYRPVSSIAVDSNWSAIRVKHTGEVKPRLKPDIPEINYATRIISPPDDLKKALKENNLLATFEKMSFTHKKEHVEAIVMAKKPETRERRIQKAIEMLNAKK